MIIPLCLLTSQSYAAIQHDDDDDDDDDDGKDVIIQVISSNGANINHIEIHLNRTWNVSGKTEPEKTIATVLSFLALLLLLPVVVVRCVHVVVVIVVVVVDAILPLFPNNDILDYSDENATN